MAKANSKGMTANGRSPFQNSYAGIPRWIMETDSYMKLNGSAVKLLNELCYQARKSNNGDLTLAFHVLKHRGWNSRTTIEKARDELIEADLIVCTREGKFLNPGGTCALYGLRWRAINESPKYRIESLPCAKRTPRCC
tara:strand:- start:251967 stop:252380 length:414 start_codon:yes stop_codon:yes gene_type:complete